MIRRGCYVAPPVKSIRVIPLEMLRLDYTLHEHGWASAAIGDGDTTVSFNVSYLGDALGDLARATRSVLRGLPEARCSFQQEPGEHRLLFARDEQVVRVTVERLHKTFSRRERGEVLLVTQAEPLQLAEEVLNCLFRVLARHGEEGYLERWGRAAFPSAEYRDLLEIHSDLTAARPAE